MFAPAIDIAAEGDVTDAERVAFDIGLPIVAGASAGFAAEAAGSGASLATRGDRLNDRLRRIELPLALSCSVTVGAGGAASVSGPASERRTRLLKERRRLMPFIANVRATNRARTRLPPLCLSDAGRR